jgi:prepilin signal peptidase PulO-like enzyme (type II secretory pathway)
MIPFFLFIFGAVLGSFLNVVALRYDGEHFVFDPGMIGGRSHCPHCGKTLRWFELVPLVSFFVQGGHCRRCGADISFQYPIVELIGGFIVMLVPVRLAQVFPIFAGPTLALDVLWAVIFLILLLVAVIDIRQGIIPDELQVVLGVLAIATVSVFTFGFPGESFSWLGSYASLLGAPGYPWVSGVFGAVFGFAFFELLVLATRGRGIGLGDVKLALPLGFLFGWPDVLFLTISGFIFGAVFGIGAILLRKKTMQGTLPFAPFLSLAAVFVFFLGESVFRAYFHLLGI